MKPPGESCAGTSWPEDMAEFAKMVAGNNSMSGESGSGMFAASMVERWELRRVVGWAEKRDGKFAGGRALIQMVRLHVAKDKHIHSCLLR